MKKEPDKIEVHKIDIKIGDKTISLKAEQLRELQKILDETFGSRDVVHWNYPIFINPVPVTYPQWTFTCDSGSSDSGGMCSTATFCLNAA